MKGKKKKYQKNNGGMPKTPQPNGGTCIKILPGGKTIISFFIYWQPPVPANHKWNFAKCKSRSFCLNFTLTFVTGNFLPFLYLRLMTITCATMAATLSLCCCSTSRKETKNYFFFLYFGIIYGEATAIIDFRLNQDLLVEEVHYDEVSSE